MREMEEEKREIEEGDEERRGFLYKGREEVVEEGGEWTREETIRGRGWYGRRTEWVHEEGTDG